MKNKKVLSLINLLMVGGVLVSCGKTEVLNYNRPFTKGAELKEDFKSKPSQVYAGENGQTIKINDPNDPTVNVLKELKMSQPIVSIYYSDAKKSGFNETKQLSVTGNPTNAPVGKVTWTSNNPSVATVDETGMVTAIGAGTAVITATSEAGVSCDSRVVVNNSNVTLNEAVKSANKIVASHGEEGFDTPDTVYVREDYEAIDTIDGVVQSRTRFAQQLWASQEHAYFRIISDDEEQKTEGGSVVPSRDAYLFYTTEDYISYVFCTSNNKANYMSLDQSFLVDEDKTPYDGLAQILESFFTSGAGIMTQQFEDVLGDDVITGKEYSGAVNKGSFGEDSGEFAFNTVDVRSGTISASDEADMGIPAGTRVTITDDFRYLWEDGLLSCKLIDEKLEYTIDGKAYCQHYIVNYYYQGRNVELWWPDMADFSLVDSIFDL